MTDPGYAAALRRQNVESLTRRGRRGTRCRPRFTRPSARRPRARGRRTRRASSARASPSGGDGVTANPPAA